MRTPPTWTVIVAGTISVWVNVQAAERLVLFGNWTVRFATFTLTLVPPVVHANVVA